jgi:putative transposase
MSEEMELNLSGRTSHIFPYTIKGKDQAVSVQVFDIVKYRKGKGKKKGVVHHPYVFFLVLPSKSLIESHYRHRFAIESTYRERNTVRAKTSSKDPVIRYFYFIVAMLLRNVWIAIQWEMFAKIQRGPKVVLADVFKFKHLIAILIEVGSHQFPLKDISSLQGFSNG